MNKVLVITGASSGIGKSTAGFFLNNGWKVINISRHPCEIETVENFKIDFSDPKWKDLEGENILGFLKNSEMICIVHNAALYAKDSVEDLDEIEFRKILEVNCVAPMMLNALLIPQMKAGSSILYIGSTLSEKAISGNASYVVSKHASVGMMRSTCQDLVDKAIHSACICPGFTETEMLKKHLKNDSAILNAIKERVGARRLIDPGEIASLVFYAANNPVINGSVLHANLGQIER